MNVIRLDEKVDQLNSKVDGVKDSVAALALSTEQSFARLQVSRMLDRVWYLLTSAALLGVMARGFGWLRGSSGSADMTIRASGKGRIYWKLLLSMIE